MSEMRVWGSKPIPLAPSKTANAEKKSEKGFNAELIGQLLSGSNLGMINGALGGWGSDLMGGDMNFGGGPKLMNINVDGVEKVWAEQLKPGMLNFDRNLSGNREGGNALTDMVSLMMREQLLKAKKQLAKTDTRQDLKSFLENQLQPTDSSSAISGEAKSPSGSTDLDATLRKLRDDVEQASQQFKIKPEQILSKLLLPK